MILRRRVINETRLGRIRGGEYDHTWIPDELLAGAFGVVLTHGSGAPLQYTGGGAAFHHPSVQLPHLLGQAGFASVAGTMSGQSWANNPSQTDVEAARVLLGTLGAPNAKVHLFGVSMGFAVAARWAAANPAKVASLCGVIPLTDLVGFYTGLPAGADKNEIATAWGVVAPAALPAGSDIQAMAATIAANAIPTRLYYSSADTIVDPADTVAFGAACGAQVVLNVGANGHSIASEADVRDLDAGDWSTYIEWITGLT